MAGGPHTSAATVAPADEHSAWTSAPGRGEPYPPASLAATASSSSATIGHAAAQAPCTFRPRKRSLSVGGENGCCNFFARQVEQYGLQPLLTSPVATCYFLASTISNYTPETLLFYLEAEHYRTASFPDNDRRTRYAKGLYKAFISHRAPLEINISHAMRLRITGTFRATEPATPAIFQETQAHALGLLEQDFAQFRQRPLFRRMMADLSTPPVAAAAAGAAAAASAPSLRTGGRVQHLRAVAAVYDALATTYGIHCLPPGKPRLVESEAPLFTKFADMDLTSTELLTALPAWLCRTTIRLLDTPMPSSHEELGHMLRATCGPAPRPPTADPTVLAPPRASPVAAVASEPAAAHAEPADSPACVDGSAKKASKQKSLQRLRLRFLSEPADSQARHDTSGPASAPATVRSRWDSLWGSRRRRP
ncbi:hypothetical protein LPJ61_000790 [Coemansia biformis]|uniref:RGS domain-containing protein n=1 Tax=Coemansia biformis TaxID=1286918 RepID=A0A9W7YGE2_9FUNG|nr:hypothetical protein LPJ61_000790 [Coemansia biformis]